MKLNKFFLTALSLSAITLCAATYARDSSVRPSDVIESTSTRVDSEIRSSDPDYGLPTSEVTIDPANAKSEEAYPPLTSPSVNPNDPALTNPSAVEPRSTDSLELKSTSDKERAKKELEDRQKRLDQVDRDSLKRDAQ